MSQNVPASIWLLAKGSILSREANNGKGFLFMFVALDNKKREKKKREEKEKKEEEEEKREEEKRGEKIHKFKS